MEATATTPDIAAPNPWHVAAVACVFLYQSGLVDVHWLKNQLKRCMKEEAKHGSDRSATGSRDPHPTHHLPRL